MTRSTFAGATALLAAPAAAIVASLVQPTISDEAADQVAALTEDRGATIAALALSTIAIALLIGGVFWLASATRAHAPSLAVAGGTLGVLGLLVLLFDNGIAATAPTIVSVLDPARATHALDRIEASLAGSGLEPLSVVADLGLALLGIAVVKAAAPRWTAWAIAVGAFAETIGFATATRALVIVGFAVLLAGLAQAVRTLIAHPEPVRPHDLVATASTGPHAGVA